MKHRSPLVTLAAVAVAEGVERVGELVEETAFGEGTLEGFARDRHRGAR